MPKKKKKKKKKISRFIQILLLRGMVKNYHVIVLKVKFNLGLLFSLSPLLPKFTQLVLQMQM